MSAPADRAAASIAPLAIAPEYAGLTGRFFKAGTEIEAPAYTRDTDVARRLWDVDAALTNTRQGAVQ